MADETKSEGATHEGVLAAIDEALGLGGNKEADTGATDTSTEGDDGALETGDDQGTDEGTSEADSGDEQRGGETGGDESAGEGTAAGATKGADKSGEHPSYENTLKEANKLGITPRHANGQIKSGEELRAEIATKQQDGDGKGDKGKPAKTADPVNDPIDTKLSQPTQERIRTLIRMGKDADERATVAQGNFDQLVGGLQAAGVTPEQFGETTSFLALFNSNDPKQQGQALNILEDMADKLASYIGVERRSTDPLANHPDLQQAIQKREITPVLARQMAVQRNQHNFRQEVNTAAQNSTQAQTQARQERDQAVTDLNALEIELKAKDPLYARKKAAIMDGLKATLVDIPPSRWKAAFQRAYATARVAALPAKKPAVPNSQPMRAGKSPAGSGANSKTGGSGLSDGGPKSMLEAVNAALAGR